ncbi:DedA family protein [Marinactinospora thermotolerans]|uniref:Membrane protein DedA, SNARE-associated domain n=1 Tax=Marinactinospora thermotolerans DSM 45154 TaxID=1122192 RepID=A0A1T4SLI8_9ACTN|nr:DedA family protein [Marinactinospora thermotolerans]SKA29057.1 membrane protein DedA, SNARE-associated domain [Marinactinospora thermotolerans DSM 45154]
MTSSGDLLADLPTPLLLPALGLFVLAETALLPGVVVPSLAIMLTAGLLAATGTVPLAAVLATAVTAAVAGDAIGFHSARLLGPRLWRGSRSERVLRHRQRAEEIIRRYGAWAMFVGRFIPFVRTLTPHLVGLGGLPYRRVAPGAVLGAAGWATLEIGVGYAVGVSAASVDPYVVVLTAAAVGLALTGGWALWRRSSRPSPRSMGAASAPPRPPRRAPRRTGPPPS